MISKTRECLKTLAEATRQIISGGDRRDWEYLETELVRAEDHLLDSREVKVDTCPVKEPEIINNIREAIDDNRTGIDDFGSHALECPFIRHGNKCIANPMGWLPCDINGCPIGGTEEGMIKVDWEAVKNADI